MNTGRRWYHHDVRSFEQAFNKLAKEKDRLSRSGFSTYQGLFLVHRLDQENSKKFSSFRSRTYDGDNSISRNGTPKYGITLYISHFPYIQGCR